MEDSDIVQLKDIAAVRSVVARTARRTLLAAALAGPVGGALVLGVVYLLYGTVRMHVSYLLAGVLALIATPQFIHWSRHYRSIRHQLDSLEQRIKNGERIYGSQVGFHPYR
jgi:hypothetical protein